jgi:hypothetical protein
MSAEKTFSGLPKWAQGAIAVGGLAIVALIGYKIYSAVDNRIKSAGEFKEKKDIKGELNQLALKGIKPTLGASKLSALANQLQEAFDGYGTDMEIVENAFSSIKNNADLIALMDTYGIRTYSSGRLSSEPDFKGTLSGAIANELDASNIKDVNKILSKNGVTILF